MGLKLTLTGKTSSFKLIAALSNGINEGRPGFRFGHPISDDRDEERPLKITWKLAVDQGLEDFALEVGADRGVAAPRQRPDDIEQVLELEAVRSGDLLIDITHVDAFALGEDSGGDSGDSVDELVLGVPAAFAFHGCAVVCIAGVSNTYYIIPLCLKIIAALTAVEYLLMHCNLGSLGQEVFVTDGRVRIVG